MQVREVGNVADRDTRTPNELPGAMQPGMKRTLAMRSKNPRFQMGAKGKAPEGA